MSGDPTIRYRPEIDGLRAWAVVPVLLYHAGFGFPGGYAGVDVFFVISGYLIGSLILKEAATGEFRFGRFWMRRIRRLFPAWAVVMAATSVAAALWLIPTHFAEFGRSLIAQPLMWANFHFWEGSGYFETASEFQPLLHTWSLAVEEQFYVLLPLVLLPLARSSRRVLLLVTSGFIVASFLFSLPATENYPSLAFFLLPARLWELNLGVLLAITGARGFTRTWLNEAGAILGLALIALAYGFFDRNTAFPGPWAALPCLGTCLFLVSTGGTPTVAGRIASSPFLVWVGKISYPLYLWHWPVFVFLRYVWISEPPAFVMVLALFVSVCLAWATCHFIERPIRSGRVLAGPRQLGGVAAVTALALLAAGVIFEKSGGLPDRFSPQVNAHLVEPPKNAALYDISDWEKRGGPAVLGDRAGTAGELVVWGDSHALMLDDLLDELGKKHGIRVVIAAEAGVAPIPGTFPSGRGSEALRISAAVSRYLEDSPASDVLLVGKWPMYLFGRNDGELDRILQEEGNEGLETDIAVGIFARRFRELVGSLETAGRRVHVLRSVAFQPRSVPETLALLESRGRDLNDLAVPATLLRERDAPANSLIDEALRGTSATVLDPVPYFTGEDGRYLMAKEGKALYKDQNHLTPYGVRQLLPLLEPIFAKISRE